MVALKIVFDIIFSLFLNLFVSLQVNFYEKLIFNYNSCKKHD